MLDAFSLVLAKQASDKEAEDALTKQMLRLPVRDLQKLASGLPIKRAFMECSEGSSGSGDWLKKYEGTTFYSQALGLEEELLKLEGERIERRLSEDKIRDDTWTREDMVRLKKRQLDLELSKLRLQDAAAEGEEEQEYDEEDEDTQTEGLDEKQASARFIQKLAADMTGGVRPVVTPARAASPAPRVKTASAEPKGGASPGLSADALGCFDIAGRAMAHAAYTKTAMPLRQVGSGVKGAVTGAVGEGLKQGLAGAAGGALGGAVVGGLGAAPGAAVGAGGGLISGGISGALSGWKKGVQG